MKTSTGGHGRIPQHLCVVMGVDIDETGSDYSSLSVQGTSRRLLDLTYGDDPSVSDPDIPPWRGPPVPSTI